MAPIRGRPVTHDYMKLEEAIMRRKSEIVDGNKIISKSMRVWKIISEEVNATPSGLYSYVSCNRNNIKARLLGSAFGSVNVMSAMDNSEMSLEDEDSISSESIHEDSTVRTVDLHFSRAEFADLLEKKCYTRTEQNRANILQRQYTVLKAGLWQLSITKKLWEKAHIKCGFIFKTHKVSTFTCSFSSHGTCNCGATITASIQNFEEEVVTMTCHITSGDGICGKRYFREDERRQVSKELCERRMAPSVYRADKAAELMHCGDPEPPHLYSAEVLKTAKKEYLASQHLHNDPGTAVAIMRAGTMRHEILNYSLDPFVVHYWTKSQTHVYQKHAQSEPATVFIDATGSIVRKLKRIDGTMSSNIFLYECVIRTNAGQFSVSQMLSEVHHTNAIQYWLLEWLRSGAPPPKEVVCDSSKALLTAAIRAFANYGSIEQYVNALSAGPLPSCYIRLDVAHFIHMAAIFLKCERPILKKFYLAALGQMILARTIDEAAVVLRSTLIVCKSETEGYTAEQRITPCEVEKQKLKSLLTGEELNALIEQEDREVSYERDDAIESYNDGSTNFWTNWGKNIEQAVNISLVEGDRVNAHYSPRFANWLMKHIGWLPLWSAIKRDHFGYGRVPASSASVESDFNHIKNRIFSDVTLPIRPDDFLRKHLQYLRGNLSIVEASRKAMDNTQGAKRTNCNVLVTPENKKDLLETETCKLKCPICVKRRYPAEHFCVVCQKGVHLIAECSVSVPGDEEGYGQKRICKGCQKMENNSLTSIISSQEVENWRGLGQTSTKSRYLKQDFVENEFVVDHKITKIPIMKNGHAPELKAIRIQNKNISLTNTCGFDSVFQVCLCALQDRQLLREYVENSENNFLKLVRNVKEKGLGQQSYRLRAEILSQIFEGKELPYDVVEVDCRVTAGTICNRLFKRTPSFVEVSKCSANCPLRRTSLPVVSIFDSSLTDKELFHSSVEETIILKGPRRCPTQNCNDGMCLGCGRLWTVLHVVWSLVYVTCGAAQLVAGIFFIISLPELHLGCNIWTGSWNVVLGIAVGMVACFGQLSSRRQELLLYMAASILTVNTVNAVLSEWCLYWADFPKLLANRPYQTLIHYACFATRVAVAVVITISFLDTQLAFCSMQTTKKPNTKKLRRSHEQVSDIEYIIPRPKSSSKPYSAYNAYAQSWVFDADNGSCSNHTNSPYAKLSQNGTPKSFPVQPQTEPEPTPKDTAHLIGNPIVQVEEASDDSTSNSDRKLNYMKSFSRCASPIILSASSSQLSLNINSVSNPPIYECLERLTEASVYRSRLNSALSNKEDEDDSQYQSPQQGMFRRVEANTPQGEKVHYASLMKELQKALVNKKESDVTSPQSTCDSITTSEKTQTNSKSSSRQDSSRTDGKNSDAEFSKELEAALQLIQDLESPNTIDTPSEPKSSLEGKDTRPLAVWRTSDASDSEKTLSAVGSLSELTSPITECHPELCTFKPSLHGKPGARVVVHCDSQSTSGYSSPTLKSSSLTPNWSTASSVNGSHNDLGKTLSCSIHNTKSTAVISLYSQDTLRSKGKSITLVNISGNNEPINKSSILHSTYLSKKDLENNNYKSSQSDIQSVSSDVSKKSEKAKVVRRTSSGSGAVWNVKSILRKKRQQGLPKLCPELEGAIVKSESLAYLSELELLARHQRNKDIQRQIEQRVLQQLGSPRTDYESNC